MDEERRKRKNKKKKNKQVKPTNGAVVGLASLGQNQLDEQNQHGKASKMADARNDEALITGADLDVQQNNGTEETSFEERIKQLQNEKHIPIQKETGLEARLSEIQHGKDFWLQKEGNPEDKITCLEETIKRLQNENAMHIRKEAGLETRITQIQCEKDLCFRKEARLEDRISQLLDENATLSLKGANLEVEIEHLRKEKESGVLQEQVTKVMVSEMRADNTKLQLQVIKLEESRNNLEELNQELMENIFSLQSQIQKLKKDAAVKEELSSQIDATRLLVDKLVMENAELVEKVNALYIEVGGQHTTARVSLGIGPGDHIVEADYGTERSEEIVNMSDELGEMSKTPEPEEIVQIPLDENEVVGYVRPQAAVPLSDAPLVGAPFRLVSFVAKYVSGADLVNRGS